MVKKADKKIVAEKGEAIENVAISATMQRESWQDTGPGSLGVLLPSGHVDKDGNLHDVLVVKEMTGNEEDLLAGKGPIVSRLNQIIANCTIRIGGIENRLEVVNAVNEMTAVDRMAALIAIRRISLGDWYSVKVQCPKEKCNETVKFNINLSEIEMLKMIEPMARSREDKIASGKIVHWHVMNAGDEEWLAKYKKNKDDKITLGMMSRIDSVDGIMGDSGLEHKFMDRDSKKNKRGHDLSIAILKSLPMRDRNEIRQLFNKHEGSVDTVVEFDCPACENEWESELDVGQPSFFFPSEI